MPRVIDEMDPYIGFWTPEKCPKDGCNGKLMTNAVGNRWCTACPYHVHNGRRVDTRDDTPSEYRTYKRGGRYER